MARNRAYNGGAIYSTGQLIVQASALNDQTITGNFGYNNTFGGAIFNQGTVWIRDSTLRHNIGAGHGGGLYNKGSATVVNTAILSNTAFSDPGGFGGGINNAAGTLTVTNSLIQANESNAGSGLSNRDGSVSIESTDIGNNISRDASGYSDGGGIVNIGHMSIKKSNIHANQASFYGGGIWSTTSGGGVISWLEIEQSTISGNTALEVGGGIASTHTHMRLTNVTISGNTANKSGGGIGIYDADPLSDVLLNNVTIVNNQLEHLNPSSYDRSGAGMYSNRAGAITITNSLIAGNLDAIGGKADIDGAVISQGYNLIQSTVGVTLTGTLTGNLLGVDPQLGPLQIVGGALLHPLLAGSPARDAAHPGTPGGTAYACLPSDQRGMARPQDGDGDGQARCDIGAFEVESDLQAQVRIYLPLLKR